MLSGSLTEVPCASSETVEFVRFCYRRRRVGWPELYDEMCAVAGRGLYRGWRSAELEEHGIGFSLNQTLQLARIAGQVATEEGDRRGGGAAIVKGALASPGQGPTAVGRETENDAGRQVVAPGPPGSRPDEERSFEVRIVAQPDPPAAERDRIEAGSGPVLVAGLVGGMAGAG